MYIGRYGGIPPVVKNLLIINVAMLAITWLLESTSGIDLNRILGLYYFESDNFRVYQVITHMFMHGGFTHLFFNMFALWMFGKVLEQVWGTKRFLIYYLVTGLGAAAIHTFVNYLQMAGMREAAEAFFNSPDPGLFASFVERYGADYYSSIYDQIVAPWYDAADGSAYAAQAEQFVRELMAFRMNIPTVGASGAVYGVLLAFGMLFPNTVLMLIFPPIPIRAKYFVMIYGGLELYLGLTQPGSNIAHFAHLGGMIFGFFLIKAWQKNRTNFY